MATTDDEQQSLLDAIRIQPEADDLRLIYADLLQQHDNPSIVALGEFIRTEIYLARSSMPSPSGRGDVSLDQEKRQALERRANELLEQHRQEWEAPLREAGVREVIRYERGLAAVSLPLSTFLEHHETLLASPMLAGVEAYPDNLRNQSTAACLSAIRGLADHPRLAGLTSLNLGGNWLGDRGQAAAAMTALGQCENLSGLTSLNLGDNWLGDRGQAVAVLEALGQCNNLFQLTSLNLGDNWLGEEGQATAAMQALAACTNLSHLTTLDLAYNWLGREGQAAAAMTALGGCTNLSNLTSLNLGGNGLGDEGQAVAALEALAACTNLSRLTLLNLGSNWLGEEGQATAAMRALGQCGQFKSLRTLDLSDNEIYTAEDVQPLCDAILANRFPAIERVRISDEVGQEAQQAVDRAIEQHRTHAALARRNTTGGQGAGR